MLIIIYEWLDLQGLYAKAILVEEQKWYYLTYCLWDKGDHIFVNGFSPKVNVIARLGFELAYLEAIVKHFSFYTRGTPPPSELQVTILAQILCT